MLPTHTGFGDAPAVTLVGISFTETAKVLAIPLPEQLLGVTEIIPPELPAITPMELEVELPVHPEGSCQSY